MLFEGLRLRQALFGLGLSLLLGFSVRKPVFVSYGF
jgi:hypothetical protein